MAELIHHISDRVLKTAGIRSESYELQVFKPEDKASPVTNLELYKRLTPSLAAYASTEGPFTSEFDMGLRTGRQRFWGRVEHIIGRSIELTGAGLYIATVLPSVNSLSLSELNWGAAVLGVGIFTAGRELASKGQQRKDIASTIINTFSNRDVIDHKTA